MNKILYIILFVLSGLILISSITYTGSNFNKEDVLFVISWGIISCLSAIGWVNVTNKFLLKEKNGN